MNNEPEAPEWMKDMFYELSAMFEELFADADSLNLEEMQEKLDEQQAHAESRALAPATIYFDGKLHDPQ
jgi:inhibitor of KinA sporulation pathway (predicted exonuclease)